MKAAKASLLLLLSSQLSSCSSSSFSRRSSASRRAFHRGELEAINHQQNINSYHDSLRHLRGGQQQGAGGSTPSYHGNYVAPAGEQPKAAVAPSPTTASAATVVETKATTATPPAPAVLASAATTNSKLSNLQERTGPAVLMLGAVYLLLKYTGVNGFIGLVLAMQVGLYSESTGVVEEYRTKNGVNPADEDQIASLGLQKWWWFATAMMMTSGRYVGYSFLVCVCHGVCIIVLFLFQTLPKIVLQITTYKIC